MQTQYWLELLVQQEKYAQIGRLFGVQESKQARSLLQVFHQEFFSEPGGFIIHSMLDNLELQYEELDSLEVPRGNIALWMNCQTDTGTYELEWDPMSLMRLGEEGVKLCVRCGGKPLDHIGLDPMTYPKWVEIEDIWIEQNDPAYTTVYVSFDDGTLWFANAVTYDQFQVQRVRHEHTGHNLHGQYFWHPHLLLLESLILEDVEQVVLDLLKKHSFERAFFSFDPGAERLTPNLLSEISMIHEEGQEIPLGEIFSAGNHEVIQTRNYSKFRRQLSSKSPSEHLTYLLDLLEEKYAQLAQYGVQKHDIGINLLNHYEGQACLEFSGGFDGAIGEKWNHSSIVLQPDREGSGEDSRLKGMRYMGIRYRAKS